MGTRDVMPRYRMGCQGVALQVPVHVYGTDHNVGEPSESSGNFESQFENWLNLTESDCRVL